MGKRLDEIAGNHVPVAEGYSMLGPPHALVLFCGRCRVPWPCDAALLLMHIAHREQVQEPGTEA